MASGGNEQHLPQALPEDIAELATHKIKKGVVRFLSSSKFVTSKSTSKLPKFTREEIVLGKLLGSGGFSHVYEIKSITPTSKCKFSENEELRRLDLMENARRRYKGKAPYVVKHMKEKFLDNPNKFRHAGTDLVIEAYFLASLSHPHIVSIRGWSAGGGSAYLSGRNDGFFLVMDRLEETLDDRIKHWSKQLKRYKQPILQKINGNVKELMFAGRLQVARDIASALTYLHEHGIVYRDLKPGNIGFDSEGVVKLFDFGLSREIPDARKAVAEEMPGGDKLFDLSGKIGTQRYMAPEVGCCYPYNQKADVYSLSLVLWECLSLEKPFANHSKSLHRAMVLEGDERPQIDSSWPYGVQALLQCSWSADIRVRPTMRALQTVLSREIEDLRVERAQPTKARRYSLKLSRMSSNRSFGTAEASGMSAFTADSMDA